MAVRHLLDGVGTFILHLGVLRQYLQGSDWLLDVNLPGLKLVSRVQVVSETDVIFEALRCR